MMAKTVAERKSSRENRMEALIQQNGQISDLVWTWDANGFCDYFSSQWTVYTGLSVEKLLGFQWLNALHPDDRIRLSVSWPCWLQQGTAFNLKFRLQRSDGESRPFYGRAMPMRETRGQIAK